METIRNLSLSLVIEKWYGFGMSREKMHDKILSPKLDRFLNNEEFELFIFNVKLLFELLAILYKLFFFYFCMVRVPPNAKNGLKIFFIKI